LGSNPPTPLSEGQIEYFRNVFFRLSRPNSSPQSLSALKGAITLQFGMDAAETAVFASAAAQFQAAEPGRQASASAIWAAAPDPGLVDTSALAAVEAARAHQVAALASGILSSCRPEVAARMLAVGSSLDAFLMKKGGN
jgi:hypothetical protein